MKVRRKESPTQRAYPMVENNRLRIKVPKPPDCWERQVSGKEHSSEEETMSQSSDDLRHCERF